MRSLLAMAPVLFVTLTGLAGISACAGTMQGSKEAMMEKGETMTQDGAMGKTDKGMMMSDKEMMEPKTSMMKEKTAVTQSAMLVGAGNHHATGTASVTKDHGGQATLILAEIRVDKVPNCRVYLGKNGDYRNGVELGKLTQFSGTVTFPIPAEVREGDYDSAAIWCKKFNVEIGRASFEKAMKKADEAMMEGKGMTP